MERPRVERQRGREIEKWGGGYMESGKWKVGRGKKKGKGLGVAEEGVGVAKEKA